MSGYFATKDRFVAQSCEDMLILRRATEDASWQEQFVFSDSRVEYLLVKPGDRPGKTEMYSVDVQRNQLSYTYIKPIAGNIEMIQERKWQPDRFGAPAVASYTLSRRLRLGQLMGNFYYMSLPYSGDYSERVDHPDTVRNICKNFYPAHTNKIKKDFSMPDIAYDQLQENIRDMGCRELEPDQLAFIRMMHGKSKFSLRRMSDLVSGEKKKSVFLNV